MTETNSIDLDRDPRSIIGVRVFDAPRDLVFSVWTDPKHLAQWWGPHGFTTTTSSFEMRPGGVWRFVMHGPDGRDYQNRVTFEEIVPPERIVYRHGGGEDVESVRFATTVTFEDLGGKTRITMRLDFPSAAERDRVNKEYGANKGLAQTLARLEQHVAKMTEKRRDNNASRGEFIMNLQPYLFFDGKCEEALDFYKQTIGAEPKMLMRFKDAPDQSMITPGAEEKVMHAQVQIGDTVVLMSDGRCLGKPNFQGFALTISAKTEAEADKLFGALGEGGQITMPLAKTFFSPRFGMLTDKFGVGWMVLVQ